MDRGQDHGLLSGEYGSLSLFYVGHGDVARGPISLVFHRARFWVSLHPHQLRW